MTFSLPCFHSSPLFPWLVSPLFPWLLSMTLFSFVSMTLFSLVSMTCFPLVSVTSPSLHDIFFPLFPWLFSIVSMTCFFFFLFLWCFIVFMTLSPWFPWPLLPSFHDSFIPLFPWPSSLFFPQVIPRKCTERQDRGSVKHHGQQPVPAFGAADEVWELRHEGHCGQWHGLLQSCCIQVSLGFASCLCLWSHVCLYILSVS